MRTGRAISLILALLMLGQVAQGQGKTLTIDDIFDPEKKINFNGAQPKLDWHADGEHLIQLDAEEDTNLAAVRKIDAASGKGAPLVDAARLEKALAAVPGFSTADARSLARTADHTFDDGYTALVLNHASDLYFYDMGAARAARLTSTPGAETNVAFSPDGRLVAFVRGNNLYVVDVASQRERAITTDGGPDRLNGVLDWVYEEEVYGRGKTRAYWWSPDSTSLAYLSLDVSDVPEFVVVDEVPDDQTVERQRYPQVGDPNPVASLGVVSATGGETRWVDAAKYKGTEHLIVRVGWTPDSSRVVFEVQDRVQTWLDLNLAPAGGGETRTLLRETGPAWVEVVGLPAWLKDGSFLWLSDRTGFRHIYHLGADGKLVGTLTSGEWDVRDLYGASPDGWVYFSAAEHSAVADSLHRVKLDGTGRARLSQTEGHHAAEFNPQLTRYVDVVSTAEAPPQTRLHRGDGALVRVIEENRVPALAEYKLGKPEFVQVKARDGLLLEAMMIKPPDFDPAKKYPVLARVYSGPGAQTVRNKWGDRTYLWHQSLAQRGYIIWELDNRSASAKGVRSAHTSYRNFGEIELRDIEDGVGWLKRQPYVDGGRIGIWGWSFGGYTAAYALTHSDSFKMGIAGAPVTDWRLYDSIYSERYMGLPRENPEGYRRSSVILAAPNLKGRLMLIHGAIDDNVHIQNTIQLANALQRAGKQFSLMIYPRSRHSVKDPQLLKHLRETMTRFVLDNL